MTTAPSAILLNRFMAASASPDSVDRVPLASPAVASRLRYVVPPQRAPLSVVPGALVCGRRLSPWPRRSQRTVRPLPVVPFADTPRLDQHEHPLHWEFRDGDMSPMQHSIGGLTRRIGTVVC